MTVIQKGKSAFTEVEIQQIEDLLRRIRASKRNQQLLLRKQLRDIGFYITNYIISNKGFNVSHLHQLVEDGTISVIK
ncbi:MAG: hypothetical protein H7Y03_14515 [Chitinophagaceae bacterium]|nr:hypothetical protein [Chitinophagaceae bacterium]